MKPFSNVHTHCTWCDGANTAREMAERALELGFSDLGFSSHSPASFDPTCPGIRDEAAYRADIAALKAEYAGRLTILCGAEQDYYAPVDDMQNYDYIIGSVHYLPVRGGQYNAADSDQAVILRAKNSLYGGDGIAMAQDFFALSAENVQRYRPDIVGHFDVLAKNNRAGELFDEDSPAYRAAALEAMDAVLDTVQGYGGMVEVNTGSMARGYRSVPYPAPFILRHMAQRGARVIATSDSHSVTTLDYGLKDMALLLQSLGFASIAALQNGRFVDIKL